MSEEKKNEDKNKKSMQEAMSALQPKRKPVKKKEANKFLSLLSNKKNDKKKVKFKLSFYNVRIVLFGLVLGIILILLGSKVDVNIYVRAATIGIGSAIILGSILEQRRHLE